MSQINTVGGGGGGGGGTGTVTSVSVVTANGFAGTVANATTTPAITLTTTDTGVLLGNGTSISGITPGNDGVLISSNTGVPSWLANGTTSQVLTATTGSPPSWQANPSIGTTEGVSLFVVDSQGSGGYTTIQSAITAAALIANSTTQQTIWIWPGAYNEDLQLVDYVHLAAATAVPVFVVGSATYTPADSGVFIAKSITFYDDILATPTFTIAGNFSPRVYLIDCQIYGNFNDSIAVTNTQSPNIVIENSYITCQNTHRIFNVSAGTPRMFVFNTQTVGANISSVFSVATESAFSSCVLNDTFTLTNGAQIFFRSCSFNPGSLNGQPIFSVSTPSYAQVYHCEVRGNSSPWANGDGNFFFNGVIADNSNNAALISNTLTIENYLHFSGPITFDLGVTTFNPVSQGTNHQVLLGTGTSAVSVVSGTGTSGQVLASNGTGSDPTWQDTPTLRNIVNIAFADTPYTVDYTANYISVDTSGGAITVNFPNTGPSTYSIVVKDNSGDANMNNITITTPGGTTLIDGAATYPINDMYNSVEVLWNTDHYEVF